MKSIVTFINQWYLWVVVLSAIIAIAQGCNVIKGLLQGSGLHGYLMDGGKGDGSQATSISVISVWNSFLEAVVSTALASTLLLIGRWRSHINKWAINWRKRRL